MSNARRSAGNNVSTHTNPKNTPFAITRPISFPNVKSIEHNARNPAIVVSELPITDLNVSDIAICIAFFLSLFSSFACSYL